MSVKQDEKLLQFLKVTSDGKFDGARANNRFGFQEAWSLLHLLQSHNELTDYIAVFDFQEDLVILDSIDTPCKVAFYQVKTKKSQSPWTAAQLVSKRKLKSTSEKKSYLEKLFVNVDKFNFFEVDLFFVANGKFKMDLGAGASVQDSPTIELGKISGKCKKKISEALGKMYPEDFSDPQKKTILIATNLSLVQSEREAEIKGRMVELIEKADPNASYRIEPIFLALTSEISKKSRYELPIESLSEIHHKAITKPQLAAKIMSAVKSDSGLGWDKIQLQLMQESPNLGFVRNLSAGFAWIQNQIQLCSSSIEAALRDMGPVVKEEIQKTNSLLVLMDSAHQRAVNGPSRKLYTLLDEYKIKGLIIYEYFKKG